MTIFWICVLVVATILVRVSLKKLKPQEASITKAISNGIVDANKRIHSQE